MFRHNVDFSSRFRILKGGKISLVVSAILVSSSVVVTDANADNGLLSISNGALTATVTGNYDLISTSENITSSGVGVNVLGNNYTYTLIDISHDIAITGASAIELSSIGDNSSLGIATGKTVSTDDSFGINFNTALANAFITNQGTINATNSYSGMYINGAVSGTTITNYSGATIDVTGNGTGITRGLELGSTLANSTITNSGTISVANNGDYDVSAIFINEVQSGVTITNEGSIEADYTGAYQNANKEAHGIQIETFTAPVTDLTITNSGTIDINSKGKGTGIGVGVDYNHISNMYGLVISNDATKTINISTTTSRGYATGIGVNAISLEANGARQSSITNSGTITLDLHNDGASNYSSFNSGIGVSATLRDATTIRNATGASIVITDDNSGSNIVGVGIAAFSDMYDTATIQNAGTITVNTHDDATGLQLKGAMHDDAQVINSNIITLTSNGRAMGIYIDDKMYDSSSLVNSGEITINSNNSSGIFTNQGLWGSSSSITNSGTITVNGDQTYGILAYGMVAGAQTENTSTGTITLNGSNVNGMVSFYNYGELVNNGTITINGTGGFNKGILSAHTFAGANTTNNGSIIINGGNVNWGMYGSYVEGVMENSDEITITSSSMAAVGMSAQYVQSGQLMNSGTISIENGGSMYAKGINVSFASYDQDVAHPGIVNSGTISVNSDTPTAKTYGIYTGMGVDSTSTLTIANSGTITATLGGELDKNAFSIDTDAFVNTNNSSTGKLYGNLNIIGSVTNSGLISLPHNADNAYIGGDLTNAGTLEIGLLTDGTTTTHSQLNVGGTATFNSGSIINVDVLSASSNLEMIQGETLENVVTANSLTINDLTVTDNSALLNFEYVQDGNTIDLNIVAASANNIVDSTVAGGGSTNAQGASQALQQASTNGQMNTFISYLGTLGTDAEVAKAVAATTPIASSSSLGAAMQALNTVNTIVSQRQNYGVGAKSGFRGGNSGDEVLAEKNLWVKPFFSIGKQGNKDGVNGYDVKTHGIGMGADTEISGGTMAGLGLFYTKGDLDVNNMNQSSDMDAYTALVYGSTPLMEGKADFLYQAGYTWQKTNSDRVDGTGSASADFTTKVAFLDLKLQRDYTLDKTMIVTPVLSTTYRHIDMPAYTESGTSAALGSIEASTSTQFIVMGGATLQKAMEKGSKLIAELNVGYDFHHSKESITASYVGAPGVSYQYQGIDNGGLVYNAGLGYETAVADDQTVNFMYNLEGEGSAFQNHMFSLNYNIKF